MSKAAALDYLWGKDLLQGSTEHSKTQVRLLSSFPTTVQCLGFISIPWPCTAQALFAALLHCSGLELVLSVLSIRERIGKASI